VLIIKFLSENIFRLNLFFLTFICEFFLNIFFHGLRKFLQKIIKHGYCLHPSQDSLSEPLNSRINKIFLAFWNFVGCLKNFIFVFSCLHPDQTLKSTKRICLTHLWPSQPRFFFLSLSHWFFFVWTFLANFFKRNSKKKSKKRFPDPLIIQSFSFWETSPYFTQ